MYKMYKLALIFLATAILCSCGKEEKPQPKPSDLDSRGVLRPLENETDPDKVDNWFTKGPSEKVEGIDIERAFQQLRLNPKPEPIIVAVIDGGIDIHHEDLAGRIWVNQKEAQGLTGIDDDNNGYIDDVYGWNFLGAVNQERSESTRELVRLKKLKALLIANTGQGLTRHDQDYFEKLNNEVTGDRTVARIQLKYTQDTINRIHELYKKLAPQLNVPFEKLTFEAVQSFKANTEEDQETKESLIIEFTSSFSKSVERMYTRQQQLKTTLDTLLNENFDPRMSLLKDNPDDFTNGTYGNNDVIGPDPLHGTHVAGIIAANRNNGQGINGVSPYAKIMALRAVPNGDEYDKDIYFAVKYAVDNGAQIINMSFGKRYSPHKDKLDKIFKYAASRGVLIVHASGNFASNNDSGNNYPNRYLYPPRLDVEIKNWIEVGASSRYNTSAIVANFSNYGKESVDIFAPGFEINSTTPNNTYAILSGTSMAAPVVSGMLSVLLAQNSGYLPEQIRQIVLRSGRNKNELQVLKPGMGELVSFGELSRTGSVVDTYRALDKLLHH